VVLNVATAVPHDLGDPLLSATLLWWNAHTVPLTDRWWDGFAFYPARGFLAYSDHRLGESLLATPLQWLGAGPVTSYNVTLLATFPLCAVAAHALAHTLTRRHDAAAICGLAYGFNPYRVAHLQHLELLAAFGMPVALLALHRFADTRRARWLTILTIALVIQGLCTSYYLVFFLVLLALWVVWFLRPFTIRTAAAVAIATLAAAGALAPIAIGYLRIHRFFGFTRSFSDMITLSGRLVSLVTASPLSWLWGWMARPELPEGELFPGLAIVAIVVAGGAVALRSQQVEHDVLDRIAVVPSAAAILVAAVAGCELILRPWQAHIAGINVSSASFPKTMSLAVGAGISGVALSSRARDAWARRSPLAFYALATLVMWLCAFGPKPAVYHTQFLYEPPYAWLMRIPIFGSIRVPARFGMLAMLTLSVCGALAFARVRLDGSRRRTVLALAVSGIVMDGWIRDVPMPALPDVWPPARADGFAAVVELPLGDPFDDTAAMYRVMHHGRPVVNGASGFDPTHYFTLKTAVQERDRAALDAVARGGPLLIVVDKRVDAAGEWRAYASTLPRVTALGEDDRRAYYGMVRSEPPAPVCRGPRLPLAAISDQTRSLDPRTFTDGDALTRWETNGAQRIGEMLTIDLGRVARPCAVTIGVGEFRRNYARLLMVDTSADGAQWTAAAAIRTASLTVQAALDDPKTVAYSVSLPSAPARFIRLRIGEAAGDAWGVGEISVVGPPAE